LRDAAFRPRSPLFWINVAGNFIALCSRDSCDSAVIEVCRAGRPCRNVAWSPPSSGGPVTNYVLIAGLTPGFTVPYATVPLGATPGFVVPGVPSGTFYVRVVAQNASGTSAPSNEAVLTVAGTEPPWAPTLLAPTVSGSTVNLAWIAGSGGTLTGYTLFASVTPGGAPIVTVPLVRTSVSFSGVPCGTYYLRLTASTNAGISPPSAQVMLTVP
jgi:hypothetical protein